MGNTFNRQRAPPTATVVTSVAAPSPASEQNVGASASSSSSSSSSSSAAASIRARELQSAISWDANVIGQVEAKCALEYAFFLPRRFPTHFRGMNNIRNHQQQTVTSKNRTFLLWGPPGTGKTLMAKAVADAHGAKLLVLSPDQVNQKHVGESEQVIRAAFQRARCEKTVIFFDEIDTYMRKRQGSEQEWTRALKNQILQEFQDLLNDTNLQYDSVAIAATNFPNELDDALMRRIRFSVFCGLPDQQERIQLLSFHTQNLNCSLSNMDLYRLSQQTELYSGSDIEKLTSAAALILNSELQQATHFELNENQKWKPCVGSHRSIHAVRKKLKELPEDSLAPARPLIYNDFKIAIQRSKPTISKQEYDKYLQQRALPNQLEASQRPNLTPLQLEMETIFAPSTSEEATLSSYLLMFKQMQRYQNAAINPNCYTATAYKYMSLCIVVISSFMILLLPSLLWLLLALLSLLFLCNSVIIPLVIMIHQSLLSRDGADLKVMFNQHTMDQMIGLVIFLVLCAMGTHRPFFIYSSWPIADLLVTFFCMFTACQAASVMINFFFLRYRYQISTSPAATAARARARPQTEEQEIQQEQDQEQEQTTGAGL